MRSVGRHGRRPLAQLRHRAPLNGKTVVTKMMYPGDLVLVKLSDTSWPAIITHIKDSTVDVKLLVLLTSETFDMNKVVLFEGLAQLEQLLSNLTPAEREDFEETKVCLLNLTLKSRQERLSFISNLGDASPIRSRVEIDDVKENRYLLPTQSPIKPMLVLSPSKPSKTDNGGTQAGGVKKLPCDIQDISLDPIKERVDRMINDVNRDDTRLPLNVEPSFSSSLVNGHAAITSPPALSITSPKFSIVTEVSPNSRKRKRSTSFPQTEIVRIDSELQKVIKNRISDGVGSVQIVSNPPSSSDRLRSRPSSRISLSPKTEEETEKIVEDLQMMELISFLAPYYINVLSSSFKDRIESEIRQNIKNLSMEEKELISKMLVKKVPGRTRKEAQNIISRLLKSSPCKKKNPVVPSQMALNQENSLHAPRISLQDQLVIEPTFRKRDQKKKHRAIPPEITKSKQPPPKEKIAPKPPKMPPKPPKPTKKESVTVSSKTPKEKPIPKIVESKPIVTKPVVNTDTYSSSAKRIAMLLYIKDLQQTMQNPLDLKANSVEFDDLQVERKNQYFGIAKNLETLSENERTKEYKAMTFYVESKGKARYDWLDATHYFKKKSFAESAKASKSNKNISSKLDKHNDALLKELLDNNDNRKRKRSTPALTPDSDNEPNAKKEKSDNTTIVDLFCFECFEIEYNSKLFTSCSNCNGLYHKFCIEEVTSNTAKPKYLCKECQQGDVCGLCRKPGNLTTCSKCPHQYHDACVRPHMSSQVTSETSYICPYHVCGSCDLPPESSIKNFVRCVRCPQSFHENHIPAGCMRLSKHHILCYRHHKGFKNAPVKPAKKKGKKSKAAVHCNVTFCFQCVFGGNLVCCEECPASFHNECVPEENRLTEGDKKWICPDCIVGKKPFIGDIIWVKFGSYRWWPCQILDEIDVPDNIFAKVHKPCQFPVLFLGTSDYAWIETSRIYSYEDGDNAATTGVSNSTSLTNSFKRALQEAKGMHMDVKLKKDILLKEKKSGNNVSDKKPAPFKFIKTNHPYSHSMKEFEKQLRQDRMPFPCDCTAADKCSTESSCINRVLLTECPPSCKWGEKCENRRFQRKKYPKSELIKTYGRGWGLIAKQDIEPGTLVHEYVGEVIDESEVQRRLQMYQNTGVTDYYMLTVENSRIIDAKPKANNARFMNHSCDPNCETQKWNVCGLTCIGLFAKRRIADGEELTFDYQFDTRGQEKKKCLCGAGNCSGFLGEPAKKIEPKENKEKNKKVVKKKGAKKKGKAKKKVKKKVPKSKNSGSSTPSESSETSSSKSGKKSSVTRSTASSIASRSNSKESDIYEDVLAIESILKQSKDNDV